VTPDPAIYALALARFGLAPGQALFVDDRQENVDGARAAGMAATLFTGEPALRAELERLGLL
jgi:2-haloacid dehalogenase